MKRILLLAALVAAPLLAPAAAQSPAGDRTQVVSYADLDLSREADVRKLDRRIQAAIESVCGVASDADPAGKNDIRRCRTSLRNDLHHARGQAIASAAQPTRVALAGDR